MSSRERAGFGLEVAGAIAIEAALTEPETATKDFLEHFLFNGADASVGLGKFVVWAGVLAEERNGASTSARHFGLDTPVMQKIRKLDKPAFPLMIADLNAVHLREALRHSREK